MFGWWLVYLRSLVTWCPLAGLDVARVVWLDLVCAVLDLPGGGWVIRKMMMLKEQVVFLRPPRWPDRTTHTRTTSSTVSWSSPVLVVRHRAG